MENDNNIIHGDSSFQFIADIKHIVERGRLQAYASVNAVMIETYWHIGERIVKEEQHGNNRADYGKQIIDMLSQELTNTFGKGFGTRNLWYFKQFFLVFPRYNDDTILHTRVQNLTWSHIRSLLKIENQEERDWYLKEAADQTWSVRTLERNISSQYYHRLLLSQKKENVTSEMQQLTKPYQQDKLEFIKNPIVAEFLGLAPNSDFSETQLESAIISNIQKFLMELGKGYAFVARQQHIRTDETDYYIDLVFYNYLLKCFILIDLKTEKISYQDVGQMDMYLQMYDTLKKSEDDNPTIGIILCADTNYDVAKYSSLAKNEQLYAAKYQLYLPTKEELKREIERQKEFFMLQNPEI